MISISSHCHSGVAMGCACCAMHKGPQPSEVPPAIRGAPSNPRGPQQSKGLRQSDGPHQSEEPQQSEAPPAI